MKRVSIVLISIVLLLSRVDIVNEALFLNQAAIFFNRAIGHPTLDYPTRVAILKKASALISKEIEQPHIADNANREAIEIMQAYEYLNQNEYGQFVPGAQLLNNPEFLNGTIGWVEYASNWESVSQEKQLLADAAIVTFTRTGEGHSSISQTFQLIPGQCYLFSAVAEVNRIDDTPTFWFYWETYEMGKPKGHYIIKDIGSQIWGKRFGVFCLPKSDLDKVKVTIAPLNLYGDVAVRLGSVRLYVLQDVNK